jgi:hypothetical protein
MTSFPEPDLDPDPVPYKPTELQSWLCRLHVQQLGNAANAASPCAGMVWWLTLCTYIVTWARLLYSILSILFISPARGPRPRPREPTACVWR